LAAKPPKLLVQAREVLRMKHDAYRIKQASIDWARKSIRFHNKCHPKDMGANDINAYLSHLANYENAAPSSQNQALSALFTFYNHVLQIELAR